MVVNSPMRGFKSSGNNRSQRIRSSNRITRSCTPSANSRAKNAITSRAIASSTPKMAHTTEDVEAIGVLNS